MVFFCIYAECISQILNANNFVFYIVYCIWTACQICIFADKGGGLLMANRTYLYSLEDQDILLLLYWVCLHMPMILQINYFDLQAYLELEDVRKVNLGAALYALCFLFLPQNMILIMDINFVCISDLA